MTDINKWIKVIHIVLRMGLIGYVLELGIHCCFKCVIFFAMILLFNKWLFILPIILKIYKDIVYKNRAEELQSSVILDCGSRLMLTPVKFDLLDIS